VFPTLQTVHESQRGHQGLKLQNEVSSEWFNVENENITSDRNNSKK
jgi:hypothetical protein